MNSKDYWHLVDETRDKLKESYLNAKDKRSSLAGDSKERKISCSSDYNTIHNCWIVSLDRPMAGVTPGAVHQVQWRQAAVNVTAGTHDLASGAQIVAELQRLDNNKQIAVREELMRRKKNYTVVVSPEEAGLDMRDKRGIEMDWPVNQHNPASPVAPHVTPPTAQGKTNQPAT